MTAKRLTDEQLKQIRWDLDGDIQYGNNLDCEYDRTALLEHIEALDAELSAANAALATAQAESKRYKDACIQMSHEIEQTLGQALGYPWYKDDQKNFPGATKADGVEVGEHVPETLAAEAANRIRTLTRDLDTARGQAARAEAERNEALHELDETRGVLDHALEWADWLERQECYTPIGKAHWPHEARIILDKVPAGC